MPKETSSVKIRRIHSFLREIIDFSIKKNQKDDLMSEHDLKMKNLEHLTKLKTRCNEFLDSQEKIMSSVMVNYLMKGIRILSKY